MKCNCFIVLLITFFSVSNSYAQKKVNYGIGLTMNYSELKLSGYDEVISADSGWKGALGFGTRIKAQYELSNKFNLAVEPGFTLNKSKLGEDTDMSSLYLDVPLKVEYFITPKIGITGGLYYQYLLGLKIKYGNQSNSSRDFADNTHFFNPAIGLTFRYVKNLQIGFEVVQAVSSLTEVTLTDLNGNPFGIYGIKNRMIQLSLVYMPEM